MASPMLLDKVRLLLVRERELMAVRQELHVHRVWTQRVQRIITATTAAASTDEAWALLARQLIDASPYEFAAVIPTVGPRAVHGPLDPALLERVLALAAEWSEETAVVELPEPGGGMSWILGGRVRGASDSARALVLVGRTSRTAGYYSPPWDIDRDHLGYLLGTLSGSIAAVQLRAALVDERNNLQAQVEQATRSLRLALEDAQTARGTAEAASRAKSVFLANMSHELRTPLNAIIGYAELLAAEVDDATDSQTVRDLDRIRTAGQHLLALISDILDLSKIEAGRMEVRLGEFDLASLVRSSCATLESLWRTRGNRLVIRCPPGAVLIRSDETKVSQILVNLVGNACKFTDGGEITVTLEATDEEVRLEVADTGIGMGPRLLARLFEPFHREEAAIEGRPAGSGLGLAICRQFCHLLQGRITAQSELGQGSVFEVRLPRAGSGGAP